MKLLGLDIGTKRTGVALSEGQLAFEHTTLNQVDDSLVDAVATIVKNEQVEKIVIGLPLHHDGQSSYQSEYVQQLGARIGNATAIPIEYIDEHLTTSEVYRQAEEQGLSRGEVEKRIDQLSARLILQAYLNDQDGKL